MTLQERQKREIQRLESMITTFDYRFAGTEEQYDKLVNGYFKKLEEVNKDPETYFKNIDKEE